MTNYRAVSESGRTYVIEEGRWWTEPDSGYGGPIRAFKVVDRGALTSLEDILGLPEAQAPEVGKSVYLATSPGNWRLSTEIVEVVEYE